MADVLMFVIVVIFFGLCVGYVSLCDRVIGPDTVRVEAMPDDPAHEAARDVAA